MEATVMVKFAERAPTGSIKDRSPRLDSTILRDFILTPESRGHVRFAPVAQWKSGGFVNAKKAAGRGFNPRPGLQTKPSESHLVPLDKIRFQNSNPRTLTLATPKRGPAAILILVHPRAREYFQVHFRHIPPKLPQANPRTRTIFQKKTDEVGQQNSGTRDPRIPRKNPCTGRRPHSLLQHLIHTNSPGFTAVSP